MSNFERFMKHNKKKKENLKVVATKSLTDENGEPLVWEIRSISTRENNALRQECSFEVPIANKLGMYREKINTNKYMAKLLANAVVYPNLNDKALQDSYGVMCAEDLIEEMIDDPVEYNEFIEVITKHNDFKDINEKVEIAKN